MSNPALNSGPKSDGANSLAKESKVGLAVTFVGALVLNTAIDALTNLDLNGHTGWWVNLATVGASTAAGLLVAYRKRNR